MKVGRIQTRLSGCYVPRTIPVSAVHSCLIQSQSVSIEKYTSTNLVCVAAPLEIHVVPKVCVVAPLEIHVVPNVCVAAPLEIDL